MTMNEDMETHPFWGKVLSEERLIAVLQYHRGSEEANDV